MIYQDGVDIAHAKTNSTTVEGLTNGHYYPFAVAAHSTSGIGPLSESAVAIPNETLTEPPSNSYNVWIS